MISVGDTVERVGSDYTFVGTVVSKFNKLSGEVRYVVEDDRGILFIWSEKNMRVVPDISKALNHLSSKEDRYDDYDNSCR